jgi:hypothetical protein
MTHLRRLAHDVRRMLEGVRTFFRHLAAREAVSVGFGQLSAESPVAVRGGRNRYRVTISNARTESRDVTLVIDIAAADPGAAPMPHYVHFSKRLAARPRASLPVDVDYDWATAATFSVGGMPLAPDALARGRCDAATAYAVNAVLLDSAGRRLERLTVYQRLAP